MAGYLVFARKYRSTTFDEVVGQEPIAQTLKNAIKTGRIAHAYLFTGTRGVGKTTVARILAKALNCLNSDGPTTEPCGKCDACVAIARGDDVDVVEIDGASNRGIDEIRDLRANAVFLPSRGRYKIYYIDEVHQITRDGFNALLKTLEEPPAHVKFIFATTEPEKIPPTILSRCQKYEFRNIPTRLIAGHLKAICKSEGIAADDDALFRVARAAAGSMRDGLSLLDQLIAAGGGKVSDADVVSLLGTPSEERTLAIASAIVASDAAGALKEFDGLLQGGVSLGTAVAALGDVFRNMMLAAVCGPDSDLVELPEQQKQAVGELAGKMSLPTIVQAVGMFQTLAYKLRGSSVARALAEATLVRLAAADKFVDPDSLARRLEALSRGQVAGPGRPPAGAAPRAMHGSTYGPGAGDVKKNAPLTHSRPSAPMAGQAAASASGAASATGAAPAALSEIEWTADGLAAGWQRVIEALTMSRQMAVASLLRAASVADFDGATLKLAFPPGAEGVRQRAAATASGIQQALSTLAGKAIRCTFDAVALAADNGSSAAAPARAMGNLSVAEKSDVMKDPAVKAVLDLFGGEIIDIRRVQAPPETAE